MSLSKTGLSISLLALLLFIGCVNKLAHKDSEPEGPAASVQTRTYRATGVVKGLDSNLPIVEIDHEEIKGLMPAMQMQFHVKDKSLLEAIRVGDRIEFTVESGVGGIRIIAIRKL
jgi:Cu/Ag efflux protein CusF